MIIMSESPNDTFYIDCEFDGHNGPLLSMAVVSGDGRNVYIKVLGVNATDPWVIDNVLPILDDHLAEQYAEVHVNEVGQILRQFLVGCEYPMIIADSPVDIGRFCEAISTGPDGQWRSADLPSMTFYVCNIDSYPTTLSEAVRHNAWWDAMALRAKLEFLDDYRG